MKTRIRQKKSQGFFRHFNLTHISVTEMMIVELKEIMNKLNYSQILIKCWLFWIDNIFQKIS